MIKINEKALTCPNCGAKISIVKKLILDPRYKWRCKKCRQILSLPRWTTRYYVLKAILIVILIYAFNENIRKNLAIAYILLGVYLLISTIVLLLFIPVISISDVTSDKM